MESLINQSARWRAAVWLSVILLMLVSGTTFGSGHSATTQVLPDGPREALVRLELALRAGNANAARQCYTDSTPEVTAAMNAFVDARMATHNLIAELKRGFPGQAAGLKNSDLWPLTDEAFDRVSAATHQPSLKTLRDGSVLMRGAAGQTAVARKTSQGWRVDFASTTHGRVSDDDAIRDRLFVADENKEREMAQKVLTRLQHGGYRSLADATHDYDMQYDALVSQRGMRLEMRLEAPSTEPAAGPANPVVSWSVTGPYVAICARDGSVKAWNFETSAVTARFTERLKPPRAEGGIACSPGAVVIGLFDPNDSKSLRVLDASGKLLAAYKDFKGTGQLPNGMVQRIVGFTPDSATMITEQNSNDYIGLFDLQAKRVARVLELSTYLADAEFSVVVALRDASGFVHFHGHEVISYDFQGHVRWREPLPNAETPPTPQNGFASHVLMPGVVTYQRPHLEGAAMVTNFTAFWMMQDKQPTRLDLRTGAMVPMVFAGSISEIVAVDADHGYMITRDPDDDSYWMWDSQGRKCMIGDLAGNQRLAFSADGVHLLAQVDPAACGVSDQGGNFKLIDPILVFRIGNGKCEKSAALR